MMCVIKPLQFPQMLQSTGANDCWYLWHWFHTSWFLYYIKFVNLKYCFTSKNCLFHKGANVKFAFPHIMLCISHAIYLKTILCTFTCFSFVFLESAITMHCRTCHCWLHSGQRLLNLIYLNLTEHLWEFSDTVLYSSNQNTKFHTHISLSSFQ